MLERVHRSHHRGSASREVHLLECPKPDSAREGSVEIAPCPSAFASGKTLAARQDSAS